MNRVRVSLIALLVLASLPMYGCSKGNECDTCSVDADCQSGLLCVNFLNGNGDVEGQRCGSGLGTTTCRVR
jgi:hypothetical protein